MGLLTFLSIILLIWSFFGIRYHIKTQYGDSFTVIRPIWDEDIVINDDNSNYFISLNAFSKKDFKSICDTIYFRCYQIQNKKENIYLYKIKRNDHFFDIDSRYDNVTVSNIKNGKKWYISDFFCDYHYMEIILPYLDELYHDEMVDIAQKLTSGDYEGLDKYGLTKEMINDKESLDEKVKIMEEYLKDGETSFTIIKPSPLYGDLVLINNKKDRSIKVMITLTMETYLIIGK